MERTTSLASETSTFSTICASAAATTWCGGWAIALAANRFAGNNLVTLHPPARTDSLYSAFVQDEITLTKTLSLTLGAKFEHNAYTGYENEPSAQLVWAPNVLNTALGFRRESHPPAVPSR